MRNRFLLAAMSFLALGCNIGGYADLGRELDPLTFLGSDNATAWMRTTDDGTSEFLVLGRSPEGEDAGFVLATMRPDATGGILAGSYVIRQDELLLSIESEYEKTAEFENPPAQRKGSTRIDHDPPEEMVFGVEEKDGKLLLTRRGRPTSTMTSFLDVLGEVDPSTQSGIDLLVSFYFLSTVTLEMRVPGFGGAGLLQYSGEPSEFAGVLGGEATIQMTSVLSPVAEILYYDYKDFPGIVIDGDQLSSTNIAGDGTVTGTMHFDMTDPRDGATFRAVGDIIYDVELVNGRTTGGSYIVRMSDGAEWNVSHRASENIDFRSALPPSP